MRKPRLALVPSLAQLDGENPDDHEEAGRITHLKANLPADALHKSRDLCGQHSALGNVLFVLAFRHTSQSSTQLLRGGDEDRAVILRRVFDAFASQVRGITKQTLSLFCISFSDLIRSRFNYVMPLPDWYWK